VTASGRVIAVGIDVGGTFTDLAALHEDGQVHTTKVLSVPTDRAHGVLDALSASSISARDVNHIAHGTTVVTNLLLERSGARVVLCTTTGFTDLLELRRQERAALYDLARQHPAPLVDRTQVVGVDERMTPDGVLTALTPAAISDAVAAVLLRAPDTVAICFLHADAHPQHEQALRDALLEALRAAGSRADVICSHEVLPEIREYERMTTTVAEAYARPAVRQYLGGLSARLAAHDYPAPQVMTSSGGTLAAADAAEHAAALALSGPAGGVTGASAIARALGIAHALTIDIGGTSADVGVIEHGQPLVERGGTVAGVPIALPRVLVEAVAAGGGSIGWIDAGGALRAGPESAGATPGPAAYGRGGVRPTITDAHVVLGHVAAGSWSGGVAINADAARVAMHTLADPLGVTVERAAAALIATADATMARALRRVSVERGVDPRDVALIAFGGGGPLHACGLADRLGMPRVVIPPHAGVLSAVGLALAPERRESLASCVAQVETLSADWLGAVLQREAERHHHNAAGRTTQSWLRARYAGQGHELDVPVQRGDDGAVIAARFAAEHRRRTGFVLERSVECLSVRVTSSAPAPHVHFARLARTGECPPDYDDGRGMTRSVSGPAVVRLPDATLLVAATWTARALALGGWMLEKS